MTARQMDFDQNIKDLTPGLTALARKFMAATGSKAEIEDIIQETFITLWKLKESGYEIRNMRALATKIVKVVCVSHYRRQKVKTVVLEGKELESNLSATSDVDRADNDLILCELLACLTPTEKTFIQMRNSQGLSLDEISEITGRPKDSIKTTLSLARRRMIAKMKELI